MGRRGRNAEHQLQGFVRTALWRGWHGEGWLVADQGLSRWWWSPGPPDAAGAVAVELAALHGGSRTGACLRLARALRTTCAAVARAAGIREQVHGRHPAEVARVLAEAERWRTEPLDRTGAEAHVELLGRSATASTVAAAARWGYPDAASIDPLLDRAAALRAGLVERLLRDCPERERPALGEAAAAAVHDVRLIATRVVVSDAGTAWPWRLCVELLGGDAAWTAITGCETPPVNPFAAARPLYRMGVAVLLDRDRAWAVTPSTPPAPATPGVAGAAAQWSSR